HRTVFRQFKGMRVLGGEPFLAGNSKLAGDITLDAFQAREGLLQQFNRQERRLDTDGALADLERTQQRAISLLTSTRLKSAFDLSNVDPKLLDRYGRTLF